MSVARPDKSLEVSIMKSLINAIAIAAVLAVPAVSFAQSSEGLTRAQVKAELAQVRSQSTSLYDQGDAHYPDGLQHAEAAAFAQSGAAQTSSSYGGAANGSSQSGVSNNTPVYNQYLGSPYARP
jgi:hypothetical protein